MGKKKIAVILGAIALAAAAAGVIWYFLGNNGKDSSDRVYVQKVSSIMGTASGAQNRYSGVVQPQKTVEINADSERTVKEILVEVGDEVSEGTPLFSYDTEDLKMELEQAKLELENQDIEISNYKNQIQELEKERNAAAEGDKFEYTTQIQTIQTQIKQAEYEKSSKKLEMDKVQKKIDNSQVTSTASGVVKTINDGKNPDQESSAFMTILSAGEYRIQGTANEQNVGMISGGTDVIIRSRVDEELTWTGTVDSLDTGEPISGEDDGMSMGDSDSVSSSSKYPFYVVMDDADGLMLGQHVLIELDGGQMEEKEGIWLFSGYIVFENAEGGESVFDSTEMLTEPQEDLFGTEALMDQEEFWDDTEMYSDFDTDLSGEPGSGPAYVWADNGSGKLEKRTVELGEYDEELDEYEILSGLTGDDLIAFPMEGLYEGVQTVTDMEEVDYTSDLYNQGGTEAGMDDMDMDNFDMDGADMDGIDWDMDSDGDLEADDWDMDSDSDDWVIDDEDTDDDSGSDGGFDEE